MKKLIAVTIIIITILVFVVIIQQERTKNAEAKNEWGKEYQRNWEKLVKEKGLKPEYFTYNTEKKAEQYSIDDLLDAIEQVESGGDANAVGDNGQAIGAYQIHKIYVDDVNRILGHNKFTYNDRWDRDKSREMVTIYITYWEYISKKKDPYTEPHKLINGIERTARIHNGGPNGYKKESTKAYWRKIEKALSKE